MTAPRGNQARVLLVIALGGMLGAAARYGAGLIWPTPAGGFPWATFGVNILGCALMGVLMVVVTEVGAPALLRPFLGTGVLGGFTTFSTYAVDAHDLFADGAVTTALLYLLGTVVGAMVAVWAGAVVARLGMRGRSR